VLALLLSSLSGCGGETSGGDGLQIEMATYEPTGDGGDNAQLEGQLVDRQGCLVIRDAAGDHILPIWPADRVSLHSSDARVDLMGEAYALGDSIEVGGGHIESWDGPIPSTCGRLSLEMFIVSD
jgi:hypothetical protein